MSEEKMSMSYDSGLTLIIFTHLKDAKLVSRILLPSIDKYLDPRGIALLVVAPRSQHEELSQLLKSKCFTVQFIADEDVANRGGMHGYRYQMLLKLAVAKHVKTRFFMTLDSDLFFVRQANIDCFVINDRAIVARSSKHTHADWYTASAKALGMTFEDIPDYVIGVTPSILSIDVCRSLVDTLNASKMITAGATEYSLYWLYMLKHFDMESIYIPHTTGSITTGGVYNAPTCIWDIGSISKDCSNLRSRIGGILKNDARRYVSLLQSTVYRQFDDVDCAIDIVRSVLEI
jgi:hypothetical protein